MLGLTQQDVVDRLAAMGVAATNRSMSAMEHGQGLDVGRLPELAAALDCTVTYLLGLTMNPDSWEPDVPINPTAQEAPHKLLSPFNFDEPVHDAQARETAQVSRA